jgi:hypothetical protein
MSTSQHSQHSKRPASGSSHTTHSTKENQTHHSSSSTPMVGNLVFWVIFVTLYVIIFFRLFRILLG